MGSVPSSLTGNRSKTAVQQICIDQNSGQVHHKRDGSSKTNRRLSSAVELASGRLKTAMKGRRMAAITELAGSSSSRHCPQQFPEMQEVVDSLRRRLCDCEATKSELEMRLRAVEKEKRELELAWARNSEMPGSTLASGLPSQEEFGKPTCQCRNWEEQLTQRLWERDQVWTRRLAEEVARRRSLLKALEWQIGTQAMDRLLAMLESQSPTFSAEHPNAECKLELAIATEIPLNQSQFTNGHPKEENAPESLPSARLSTASTMQSTNNEQQQQHMTAKFRSSRRNLTSTDGKAPSLDLDGICLAGPLAEEFEFEEGQQQPANGPHIGEQRRASTSAKSRDSGISY